MKMEIERKCSKCRELKPLSSFFKDASKKDGYQFACKTCSKNANKKSWADNQEAKLRINGREY